MKRRSPWDKQPAEHMKSTGSSRHSWRQNCCEAGLRGKATYPETMSGQNIELHARNGQCGVGVQRNRFCFTNPIRFRSPSIPQDHSNRSAAHVYLCERRTILCTSWRFRVRNLNARLGQSLASIVRLGKGKGLGQDC